MVGLKGMRVLVAGASSGLASSLNRDLAKGGAVVGLHYNSNAAALGAFREGKGLRKFKADLGSRAACWRLVDEFVRWAGGIDALVQLTGDIKEPVHWEKLTERHWRHDLDANLVMPFFLAQRAAGHMKGKGGRIILTSTASARHGGGGTSMAYGAAKAGVECMTKGLARDCAKYGVLVNAVAPGFVKTKFHTERMRRSEGQLRERAGLVPLGRPGTAEEIGGTIMFLLSGDSSYITGEVIAVSGGDWL
jgi:NAD(P)-dependent dehydrogenase (short-subunit alcohol dehydrogenase family)